MKQTILNKGRTGTRAQIAATQGGGRAISSMEPPRIIVRNRLKDMQTRVQLLCGLTSAPGVLTGMERIFERALKDGMEQEDKMRDLLGRARNHDPVAMREMCELRTENIELFVRATSRYATMFYENVTLKDNEQACIETSYRNPIRVRYLAQDGGAHTVKAVKARKQVYIDMRELHTNEIGYQMRDIQQGNDVASASAATVDLGWEMNNMVDAESFNLMYGGTINGRSYGTSIYGAFVTTGAPLSRTYIPHPRIQTGNLPTTNDLTLSDTGTAAGQSILFRLNVIRAIINYCASWGDIIDGMPVSPTGVIMVPSSQVADLTQEVLPTGTFYNKVAEGLLQDYTQFDYVGKRWILVPDVTLPRGVCYPVLNRPVGKLFTKPSMDDEFIESDPRNNWETRSQMKVLAMYIPEPNRIFGARVTFSNAPTTLTTNE